MAWEPLFVGARTPVANPGVAALTGSKRLPLAWDALATPMPTWRRLSPEARAPGDAPWRTDDGRVLEQAYSNIGATVSMRSEMTSRAWTLFSWKVRLAPGIGYFDNRSVCFPGDFPPANTLHIAGIRRAVRILSGGERPAVDLAETLCAWQEAGIALLVARADTAAPTARRTLAAPRGSGACCTTSRAWACSPARGAPSAGSPSRPGGRAQAESIVDRLPGSLTPSVPLSRWERGKILADPSPSPTGAGAGVRAPRRPPSKGYISVAVSVNAPTSAGR